MLVVLNTGDRIWYGGQTPTDEDDPNELLDGILLCVIRHDGNFKVKFRWRDVVWTDAPKRKD